MLSIDVDHGLSIDGPADLPGVHRGGALTPAMLSIDRPADLPRVHQGGALTRA